MDAGDAAAAVNAAGQQPQAGLLADVDAASPLSHEADASKGKTEEEGSLQTAVVKEEPMAAQLPRVVVGGDAALTLMGVTGGHVSNVGGGAPQEQQQRAVSGVSNEKEVQARAIDNLLEKRTLHKRDTTKRGAGDMTTSSAAAISEKRRRNMIRQRIEVLRGMIPDGVRSKNMIEVLDDTICLIVELRRALTTLTEQQSRQQQQQGQVNLASGAAAGNPFFQQTSVAPLAFGLQNQMNMGLSAQDQSLLFSQANQLVRSTEQQQQFQEGACNRLASMIQSTAALGNQMNPAQQQLQQQHRQNLGLQNLVGAAGVQPEETKDAFQVLK